MREQIQQNLESVGSYVIGGGAITLAAVVDFASAALQFLTLLGGCVVVWHRFYMDRQKAKRDRVGGRPSNDR